MADRGRPTLLCVLFLLLGLLAPPRAAGWAQDLVQADRGPRFLQRVSVAGVPVPVDLNATPVLRRRISLTRDRATLGQLLAAIRSQTGLELIYSADVVPADRPIGLRADSITVAAALTEILLDAGVDVVFYSAREAGLVRRVEAPAAPGTIVGRVTDAKTGEPLLGAEVRLEGTRWRVGTTGEGRYRLAEVTPGAYTLTVRRIGYARRSQAVTVAAEQELTVDVALEPVATRLGEVVTTVTGEQRLRELGHVVGRINADSLVKEAPISNVTELLNGRVPGLQVFTSQGTVGGDTHLQIRGANSVSLSTEPIVIVDGIRYTNTSPEGQAVLPSTVFTSEPTSRLNDLNPNDIESIEVVKGPSAATLYGTDASNGVIVITTKRGRPGPARWNVYMKGAVTDIPDTRYPDSYWGWGSAATSCTLARVATGACVQDSVSVLPNPLNDPALSVFGSQPRWELGTNVAGGRQDLRYYFSADLERATGPLRMPPGIADSLVGQRGVGALPDEQLDPNAFTKLNLRSNVSAILGEKAELRINAGYSRSATRTISVLTNPYTAGFAGTPAGPYSRTSGPSKAFSETSTERVDRFVGSVSGQWRPAPWLLTRATAGLDLAATGRYSLSRLGEALPTSGGAVGDDRTRSAATTAELGATASVRRGRLSSRTAVGVQYVRNLTDGLSSSGFGLPPGGASVGAAATTTSRQAYGETVTLGSYLEETVGWNDRLFVTGAARVDGASAFGRDYAAALYPKASVSWILSEEPFVPRLPGLDELRLRYAFGASGQQATPFMALPQFTTRGAVLDGQAATTIDLYRLGNPDLRPERVREHEFGFDADALEGRVQLGLTWYRRNTVDQVVFIPLPPGLGTMYTNLGRTAGRGFEAQLTARLLDTRLVSWDLAVQHSAHTTELVHLAGSAPKYSAFGGWVEGYPLGARFVRPILGYADANGNGIIESSEVQLGDTPVYGGQSTAPRSQTLSMVVGLFRQRLRLSGLLERRAGFTQVNSLKADQCSGGRCRAAVDPSTPFAQQAEVRAIYQGVPGNSQAYFTFVEPGDFTRLREVTAALDLPAGVARALRVRSATLSLAARNLALWTAFSGADPESATVSRLSGGFAKGIPQGRSWTMRLDLGF